MEIQYYETKFKEMKVEIQELKDTVKSMNDTMNQILLKLNGQPKQEPFPTANKSLIKKSAHKSVKQDNNSNNSIQVKFPLEDLMLLFETEATSYFVLKSKHETFDQDLKFETQLLSLFSKSKKQFSINKKTAIDDLNIDKVVKKTLNAWNKILVHPHITQFRLFEKADYKTLVSRLGIYGNYTIGYSENLYDFFMEMTEWIRNANDLDGDKYLIWQPLAFYFIRFSRGIWFNNGDKSVENMLGKMFASYPAMTVTAFIKLLNRLEYYFVTFLVNDLNWSEFWDESMDESVDSYFGIHNMSDLLNKIRE
ncbi:hypothetical protein HANVADRAFT_54115 [Hanseniaspora valbyensis NRRL Y-1626]|uniref:Uncharacterized protein n=1 Tax=Hanseniaspora valbyensis NRRL Y-1626 TaxID=766949 RepID=A0A1B7T8P7_9ASCO|nr:hypothetical protein HANVADRAFT_54115 [Hanseniaspora valbyensis NRRL Y-1626]